MLRRLDWSSSSFNLQFISFISLPFLVRFFGISFPTNPSRGGLDPTRPGSGHTRTPPRYLPNTNLPSPPTTPRTRLATGLPSASSSSLLLARGSSATPGISPERARWCQWTMSPAFSLRGRGGSSGFGGSGGRGAWVGGAGGRGPSRA